MIPIISVVGFSNSGKTTLLVKIIKEIKKRGYKVAIIKHHSHDFDIDHEGKDTYLHAKAGADTVVISSPTKYAIVSKVEDEKTIDELAKNIKDVDIIITEGYKSGNKPKIEVFRKALNREGLFCSPQELIAIASDFEFNNGIPCFSLDDANGIVELIIKEFLI
ncbi:MAG: molybdopterin-guanine dinucleotide biosynthesis protein B [Clostridium sp.]